MDVFLKANHIFMLTTLAFMFLILWIIGLVTGYTFGWWIHLLLVAAIVLFIVRIVQGGSKPAS